MALFFEIKTDDDRELMEGYDSAVAAFRKNVADAMMETADKVPSARKLLMTAAGAIQLRPLPSEVNDDPAALHRLALSGLVSESVFTELFLKADTREAATNLAVRMREIGKATTGLPQFAPLTQALIAMTATKKQEISTKMAGAGYGDYFKALVVAGVGKPILKGPKPPQL